MVMVISMIQNIFKDNLKIYTILEDIIIFTNKII